MLAFLFRSSRPADFDRFRPILAIVGSSTSLRRGFRQTRAEPTHKVLIDAEEVEDPDAARAVAWLSRASERTHHLENRQRSKAKLARVTIDEAWYERN